MDHTFVVYTEKGKADSLRESVKLFFTLTPVNSEQSQTFSPTLFKSKVFDENDDDHLEFSWDERVHFRVPANKFPWHWHLDGWRALGGSRSPDVSPGDHVTMTSSPVRWIVDPQSTFEQPAVTIVNKTGVPQDVCLGVQSTWGDTTCSLYEDVPDGAHIVAPSDLVLQAYVADISLHLRPCPRPDDLARPLFAVPLSSRTLPMTSSWKLVQNRSGEIKLINDDDPTLGQNSIETLAKSLNDMSKRFSLVLKTLEATQDRLATFEKLLCENRVELLTTQKNLTDAQEKLHLLGCATPMTAKLEKALALALAESRVELLESVTRADTGVASSQQGQADLRSWLSGMENASAVTQSRLSGMEQTIPLLSEKAASASNEQRLSTMEQKDQFSVLADGQIPQMEAKSNQSPVLDRTSMVQRYLDFARDRLGLSTWDRRVLDVERTGADLVAGTPGCAVQVHRSPAGDSATAIQEAVGRLDRQIPEMEANTGELEGHLIRTKKDVSVLRKLLRTRLPALESRADTLEKSVGQVREELSVIQGSLASSGGRLAGLDARIAAVEGSLRGIGTGPHGAMSTTASCSHSPFLFPGRQRESPTSTPSPSQETAFFDQDDSDFDFDE